MAEYKEVIDRIIREAERSAKVKAYHAPSPSAGEKIIYRCTPAEYDGEFEHFRLTMRFISRSLDDAFLRAGEAAGALCRPGDRGISVEGGGILSAGDRLYIARENGGNSGFIGRTGHFYVLSVFDVKFRRSSVEGYGIVETINP